jgi:O-antigen ligase
VTIFALSSFIFNARQKEIIALKSQAEPKFYITFYIIMIIGIPFAFYRREAFNFVFLNYLVNIIFFIIFIYEVNSLKRLKGLIFIAFLSGLIYSFFGYLFGSSVYGRFKIYGAMFDPNDIAYVLISLVPFSIYYLQFKKQTIIKILAVLSVCASTAVILLTGSRGGLVASLVVLTIIFFTKAIRIKLIYKVTFFLLVCGVGYFIGERINVERYMTIVNLESDYNVESEFGRMQIWERAISFTIEYPLTGVGVQCFPMALGYSRTELGLIPKWQAAHNAFLQISAETGLVGSALFVFLTIKSLISFFRISKIKAFSNSSREIKVLSGLMLLAFIGHITAAFFLSQGYSIFFTMFFAMAVSIKKIAAESLKKDFQKLLKLSHDRLGVLAETPLNVNYPQIKIK